MIIIKTGPNELVQATNRTPGDVTPSGLRRSYTADMTAMGRGGARVAVNRIVQWPLAKMNTKWITVRDAPSVISGTRRLVPRLRRFVRGGQASRTQHRAASPKE